MTCKTCGYYNTCPRCTEWLCAVCGEPLEEDDAMD